MTNENESNGTAQPALYEIRLRGQLGPQWTDWFGGLTITPTPDGDTLLTGNVRDQAALHAVLARARDLGLPLISICQRAPKVEPAQTDKGDLK